MEFPHVLPGHHLNARNTDHDGTTILVRSRRRHPYYTAHNLRTCPLQSIASRSPLHIPCSLDPCHRLHRVTCILTNTTRDNDNPLPPCHHLLNGPNPLNQLPICWGAQIHPPQLLCRKIYLQRTNGNWPNRNRVDLQK